MKRRKHILLSCLLSMTSFLSGCNATSSFKTSFASYKTLKNVDQTIYYDDDYFAEKASIYNPKLATASALLALSGFSVPTNDDFSKSDFHAKEFFNALGFSKYQSNKEGVSRPTEHSFGVYMASKQIEDYTLIGASVRGANYFMEWAGNVTLGSDGEFALGFKNASDIYLRSLQDYIKSNNIKGHIKLWTAGYSRGGAGVNLSVGRIDDGLLKGEKVLGDQVEYTKEDLYAYCFEAPCGKQYTLNGNEILEKGENYSNIHCLVNLNDLIPYVGPKEFGFVRYGVDHYLPDLNTDFDYGEHVKRVQNHLNELPNHSTIGDYMVDSFKYNSMLSTNKRYNYTFGRFVTNFIHELANAIGGREAYASNLQNAFSSLFSLLFKHGKSTDSFVDLAISVAKTMFFNDTDEFIITDLQHNRKKLWKDFEPLLSNALKRLRIEGLDVSEFVRLFKSLFDALTVMAGTEEGFACFPNVMTISFVQLVMTSHLPELLLCHMKAMDENYTSGDICQPSSIYYQLQVENTSDYSLYQDNKEIAVSNIDTIETSLTAEKAFGYDIYYLPAETDYKIVCRKDLDIHLYQISSFTYEPVPLEKNDDILSGDIVWLI